MARKQEEKEPLYFPTGSTLLDLVVGGGEAINYGMGYPSGTIVRDWGNTSSSKTFKACETIAASRYKFKDSFSWVYDDTERGNFLDSKKLYGFDIIPEDESKRTSSKTVEEWEYNINKCLDALKPDEKFIYVLDSLDGLSSKEMIDRKEDRHNAFDKGKEFDEGTYGANAAKFLSQEGMRGLASKLYEKNALLYIISQERDNLKAGLYQRQSRLGGGRAVTFYETVRIYSRMKLEEEKHGRAYGVVIQVEAEKTRHPRPWRKCLIPLYFDFGLDDIGSCLDFLYDLRSEKTGELLKAKDDVMWNFEATGRRADIIKYIEEHGQQEELRQRTISKWEEIESEIKIDRVKKYGE